MAALNKCFFLGNLTRDPEIRYLPDGTPVCSFSLAITRKSRTAEGEKKERTLFMDCEAWRRQAEVIGEHCKKGDPFLVEGWLECDEWNDKGTGEKRKRLFCRVDNFQFINGRENGDKAKEPEKRDADGNVVF